MEFMNVKLRYKRVVKVLTPLTDKQWTDLQRLSALPDKARIGVDWAIAYYRECRRDEQGPSASEARERLHAIEKLATALSEALNEITETERLFEAVSGKSDQKKCRKEIEKLHKLVATLTRRLRDARMNIHVDRRGPKRDALGQAINHLNLLLIDHTGRPLNTFKKNSDGYGPSEFAIQVMKIADKSVKLSAVLNKIRQLEEEIKYWDDEYKPWLGEDLRSRPNINT
jgi:hypothetical protein